jgi:hypothetical protein
MTIPPPRADVTYPKITPVTAASSTPPFRHAFTFEGKKYEITVKIDGEVLDSARRVEKVVKMTSKVSPMEWGPGLQWALITDPAQDSLYGSIASKLQSIRAKKRLDADRYAELIVLFVQSIEYCSSPGQPPKYPIETIADRCGDCDDKSRLLAGLLHREGYDVSLLVFDRENHMAVGIREGGDGFMNSGYAYIETTSPSYIGFPSYEYSEVKLTSTPEVILLGKKPKRWGKSAQVLFLYETLNREREHSASLREELAESKAESESLKAEYEKLSADLEQAKGAAEAKAYNRLVDKTNRAAKAFNRAVNDHNTLVHDVNQSAEIVSRIFDNPDDRHGVYRWVKKKLRR